MSRAYRVSVSESVRRHIKVDDGICAGLEILDVLPRENMSDILSRELEGLGFESDGEGNMVRVEEDGVTVSVNVKDFTVTIKVSKEEDYRDDGTREGTVYDDEQGGRARIHDALRKDLENKADKREKSLQGEVTEALEKKLGEVRGELDRVSNRVVSKALKEKAKSLGEVKEVSENEETGELTIRVKL